MNFPLSVAPLTREDESILELIRIRWRYPLNHWYQYYDRHDGDLMLALMQMRAELLGSKAMAHRMLDGRMGADAQIINGHLVWLA